MLKETRQMPTKIMSRKKWLVTVDSGDYLRSKAVSRELNMPLNEYVRYVFKKAQDTDPDELKQYIHKAAAAAEIENIEREKEKLTTREKELKQFLSDDE